MHEMAIAEGILKIALDYGEKNQARKIQEVGLLIGDMSGVETEALEFSFRMISEGTMAAEAKLSIKRVPLVGKCGKCGREFAIEHYDFWCPECKDGVLTLLSGREMQVEYLEVD